VPIGDAVKYGILRTRDLVELYYGARMVVSVKESFFTPTATWAQIMSQDARRIRYELILTNTDGGGNHNIRIGTPGTNDLGTAQSYFVAAQQSLVIQRSFEYDLEGVCLPLNALCNSGVITVSVRETFLTPPPVDEFP
jgi:hypothetical protein